MQSEQLLQLRELLLAHCRSQVHPAIAVAATRAQPNYWLPKLEVFVLSLQARSPHATATC